MPRSELKLDAETEKAMELMKQDAPVEVPDVVEDKPVVETPAAEVVKEAPKEVVKEPAAPEPETKTVPLAALQETREALKEEKRRNEENQRKTDERLRLLTEALTQAPSAQTKEQVIPDPEKDAMGALKYTQKQLQDIQEYQRQQQAIQQSEAQKRDIMTRAANMEREFIATTPDYNDAGQFLMNSRRNELLASGMYAPNQINDILRDEAQALAGQAMQAGNNPAQIIYNIAKARGYTKVESKPAVQTETEQQKLDRIGAGQSASKSIGQAQGAQLSSGAKLDSKTLANMSDDEFQKLYLKMSRGERAQLMGN